MSSRESLMASAREERILGDHARAGHVDAREWVDECSVCEEDVRIQNEIEDLHAEEKRKHNIWHVMAGHDNPKDYTGFCSICRKTVHDKEIDDSIENDVDAWQEEKHDRPE